MTNDIKEEKKDCEATIRIGTFNIRRDTVLDGPYDLWRQRRQTCCQIIENFDIIAVQDLSRRQLNDVMNYFQIPEEDTTKEIKTTLKMDNNDTNNTNKETNERQPLQEEEKEKHNETNQRSKDDKEAITNNKKFNVYYESSTCEEDGEYIATFYDANKFECVDQGKFWLSEERLFHSKSWESTRARHVLWCKFRIKDPSQASQASTPKEIASSLFYVFSTHLDESERSRRMATLAIREMMDKFLMATWEEYDMDDIPIPFFMLGDFNCTNTSIVYDYFLKGHSPNETRKQRGSFHSDPGRESSDSDSDEDEDIDMIDCRSNYLVPTFTGFSEPQDINMDSTSFQNCILPKTISGPRGTPEGTSTDFILVSKHAPIQIHQCNVVQTLTDAQRFPSTHRPLALTFSYIALP